MFCGIPKCTHTHSKKRLEVAFFCDVLLAGDHNRHLGKAINNHKNSFISPLGGRDALHVVHRDGFPLPVKSRQRGVQALFICVRFGNRAGGAILDILVDILSNL
jgi:hypothetical protein